jgi:ABC-2 type transport system ATP-binding protein
VATRRSGLSAALAAVNDPAIRTDGLTKHYGDVHAVEDLDLRVEVGEVFGFLGPNGAGKTTTIRALLDYLRPTRGRAQVLGLDAAHDSVEIRRRIGYMPSEYEMYDRLTGAEMLRYYANLRGGVDEADVAGLAERLNADLSKKMRDYSTGNKQKIGLIQAFMNRPQLLILDEPSSGLDPLMQHELQAMVDEVRSEGRTVFLSSHTLSEVERVADRVGILREGHLVEVESVQSLRSKAIRRIDLDFRHPVDAEVFASLPRVRSATATGNLVSVSFDGEIADLLRVALDHDVINLDSREADLEEIFLAYYRGSGSDV